MINRFWLRRMLNTPLNPIVVQAVVDQSQPKQNSGKSGITRQPRPKTFSIRGRNTQEATPDAEPSNANPDIEVVDFNAETLKSAWEEFMGYIRPRSELHFHALQQYVPEPNGAHGARLEVRTRFDMNYLSDLESKVLAFMRLKFNEPHFSLETAVNPEAKANVSPHYMRVVDYIHLVQEENEVVKNLMETFKLKPL